MTINFSIVGKLSLPKESDKFKNYEDNKYPSGWINRTLKFNITSGYNSFLNQVKGGKFEDEHNLVYLRSVDGTDDNGKKIEGENFTIPWKERLTHPRLKEVVGNRKFCIDLEEPNRRWKLKNALEKLKEGKELTAEELKELNVSKTEDLESELEKSEKKLKEFVTEWDYAEFLHKIINSEKYKDKKFRVNGEYQMQYAESTGRWFNNYVPKRIYLVDDNEEETATATVDLFFNSESLDKTSVDDNGKYYVNGYVFVYDRNRKANIPAPYQIVIPVAEEGNEKDKKREEVQVKRFECDDEDTVYEYRCEVKLLNGSQLEKITFDDLTEEEQDSILIGEKTLEELQRELGGGKFGERVAENVFVKPARGFSKGRIESGYTAEDLVIKSLDEDPFKEDSTEDEEEDLFA